MESFTRNFLGCVASVSLIMSGEVFGSKWRREEMSALSKLG